MLRTLGKKVDKCFQTHTYPCTPGTQGPLRWVLLYLDAVGNLIAGGYPLLGYWGVASYITYADVEHASGLFSSLAVLVVGFVF